ncbi:MAG: hypothetical protein NXI10_13540 [bacterium]|nr:hypothetical protein [bacterium]
MEKMRFLLVLVGLVISPIAEAQINNDTIVNKATLRRGQSQHFFKTQLLLAEPTIISPFMSFNNSGKRNYILNAETRVPIGLGGKGWTIGNNNKYWISYVELTPEFKVRIFQNDPSWGDSSMPVRTPSYLPGLSYIGASKRMWEVEGDKKMRHYVGVKAYHHSNGQDGPEIQGDTINLYNGNFGEQIVFQFFWGGMITHRKDNVAGGLNRIAKKNKKAEEYDKTDKDGNKKPRYKYGATTWAADYKDNIWFWRTGFEYHPWETWGTNTVYRDYKIYGRHRLQLSGGLIIAPFWKEYAFTSKDKWKVLYSDKVDHLRKELFRFTASIEYILDGQYYSGKNINNLQKNNFFDPTKRLNLHLTMYWRVPGTPMAALFARASYIGSDNYNVYFQNSYVETRLGIGFNFFDFDSRDEQKK